MSEMTQTETNERWSEGLKKAASRARELSVSRKNLNWSAIAASIDGIREKGERMIVTSPLSRSQVIADLDGYQKKNLQ